MPDTKINYGASASITCTLASLASDSALLAGRESGAVDNSANKYLDYLLAGYVTTGTSPTDAKQIEVWVFGCINDLPIYPDVLDGSDSNESFTSRNVKLNALKLAASMQTDNVSDRTYYFGPISIAQLFGGIVPKKWGVFVVHNTGAALNATGTNHNLSYTPVYTTSA